ncbi:MAG: cupin [Betaproteobacteria bacterium]|nr:cupin [Betaproteobacteria bacterium]
MDLATFKADLERDGFTDIDTRSIEPNLFNAVHSHPFHVRAQMLEGELVLRWEGKQKTYRAGNIFTMATGCERTEWYGPEGAKFMVGRRPPTT